MIEKNQFTFHYELIITFITSLTSLIYSGFTFHYELIITVNAVR